MGVNLKNLKQIASNYPLNEQWAPLAVYGKSTPSKETTGPAQTRKAKRYENKQSEMPNSARAAFAWARWL